MAEKGSEIAQGQRCSVGVGCLLFGFCTPKQSLKGSGERLLNRKLGVAVEKGTLASQPKLL